MRISAACRAALESGDQILWRFPSLLAHSEGVTLPEIAETIGKGLNVTVVSMPAQKEDVHMGCPRTSR